jgi:two-component system, LuxR family, response regulator FixJ
VDDVLSQSSNDKRGKPICVVDDDPSVCDSLSVVLEAYGFEVLTYPLGADFLADERHRQAKFLVVDHHMPGMSGLEVIGTLRRRAIPVAVVLMTGRLETGATEKADGLGVIAILEKPFVVARLVDLVRTRSAGSC